MKHPTRVLKLTRRDEKREIQFELETLGRLTVAQRFRLMKRKTGEILRLLQESGHRRPAQILKRS